MSRLTDDSFTSSQSPECYVCNTTTAHFPNAIEASFDILKGFRNNASFRRIFPPASSLRISGSNFLRGSPNKDVTRDPCRSFLSAQRVRNVLRHPKRLCAFPRQRGVFTDSQPAMHLQ